MNHTKKLCFTALMMAVGILLPMAFHAIPNGGSIFAPMHLPVMCAGFLCGPLYGAMAGVICPLLSCLFTGMPTVAYLPNMIAELLVYGSATGLFFRLIKTKNFVFDAYVSLILAMLAGRIVGGVVAYLLFLGGMRNAYSWNVFFTTYFITCWPAIVIQLLIVPSILMVAKKMRFLTESDRFLDPQHRKKNVQVQQRFFDGMAENWRKNEALSYETAEEIFMPAGLKAGDKVLDVGCGAGVIDAYLLECGCSVDAIDLSEKMIDRAKANPENNGVNYAVADFYEYMGGSGYDCIIVFDAYPHFIDKRKFVEQAHRLLKEGGVLWIAFDESGEKINGYHSHCNGKISIDLMKAEKEAKRFEKLFERVYLRDDDRYILGFKKKFDKIFK